MQTIVIMDERENEIMTVVFDKEATVMEAMDALVNLKKKELNSSVSTGFRETGA